MSTRGDRRAFSRHDADTGNASGSWSPSAVGVWTSQLLGDVSALRFATPVRRSTSAYDEPIASYRDDAGHFYVLYLTRGDDVTE